MFAQRRGLRAARMGWSGVRGGGSVGGRGVSRRQGAMRPRFTQEPKRQADTNHDGDRKGALKRPGLSTIPYSGVDARETARAPEPVATAAFRVTPAAFAVAFASLINVAHAAAGPRAASNAILRAEASMCATRPSQTRP